ncbi:MAG TPA: FAD-dependent oxidoreductase [Candidatus Elarobacter sp.]|nr:FAD-dependent oxidoreductase [Candidatus Elarobacter sp.]
MSVSTAEIVVIGGGVIGASVAYHLAARGVHDVLVLDRGTVPGSGSTGRATGGFRVQFASAIDVRLSLLAREALERFADETGGDAGFEPRGYLWIAENDAELRALHAALAVQRANGVTDASTVDAGAIAMLNPAVRREPVAGGTFCARDGFIRPLQILDGYRRAAERLGARFEYGIEAMGFEHARDGRIRAVTHATGTIATGAVVNAAGAWAAQVAAWAGVDVPVVAVPRFVTVTAPTDALPDAMPMTIYAGDGFHLRVRDGRVLLLMPGGDASRTARVRVPVLADVEIDGDACWSGLYEMSPDGHAILGPSPGVPNLYLVNGSSGHGVMHAPALGRLLAEIIADGAASSLDVRMLRPERFATATRAHARVL